MFKRRKCHFNGILSRLPNPIYHRVARLTACCGLRRQVSRLIARRARRIASAVQPKANKQNSTYLQANRSATPDTAKELSQGPFTPNTTRSSLRTSSPVWQLGTNHFVIWWTTTLSLVLISKSHVVCAVTSHCQRNESKRWALWSISWCGGRYQNLSESSVIPQRGSGEEWVRNTSDSGCLLGRGLQI